MKHPRAKGKRIENKCKDQLIEYGYTVDCVEKKGKFLKEKDMYGLFDLIAINKKYIQFVQVTCNKPHTHKPFIQFSMDFPIPNLYIVQWVWYDNKGWKYFLYKNGKKIVSDMRKLK